MKITLLLAGSLLLAMGMANAEQIVKPHTFSAGTPASATEVNANFDRVYEQVNTIGGAINVDKNSQVGIGTAAPTEKLEVTGRIKGESLQLTVGAADGYFLVTDAVGIAHWQKGEINADNDPTNELQTLSLVGSNLTLSKGGNTVSIADGDSSPTNELQTLSLVGSNLTLSNGNTVNIADGDSSSTNELQTLSLVGSNLTLSNGGGTVSINDGDNSPGNELNTSVTMTGSTLQVNDGGGAKAVNLAETLGIDNLSDAKYSGTNYSLFLGNGTGSANTGGFNTGVGGSALHANTTGNYNTAVGSDALSNNTTGNYNIVIGSLADQYNQAGANNTIIGYQAGLGGSLHSKSGNVFLGNQAGYSELGSNKLYIDNSSTPTPLLYGDFTANALTINGTLTATGALAASGNATVAGTSTLTTLAVTGNSTLAGSLDVAGNAAIGSTAVVSSTLTLRVSGDTDDAYSGYYGNQDVDGAAYGLFAVATGTTDRTNDIHTGVYGEAYGGNANYGLRGYVGDAGATNNYGVYGYAGGGTVNYAGYFEGNLHVTNNITYDGTITDTSDARLKENIRPVENGLAKVAALNGVYFNMKNNPGQTEVGVIAQDVQKVLPEAVSVIDKANGYLGVSYPSLIPLLIEAVKELQAENAALKILVCQDHPEADICR